jgi:hypothetical protein
MGTTIDSRMKPPHVGIPMLQTKYEVKAIEHNSLAW